MESQRFHLTRSTIALSIKAIAILGAIIAIYFQDLAIIANEAIRSELMSHIIAIAFLLFLTPLPLETIYAAGATLSTISSEAAYNVLKAIGLPAKPSQEQRHQKLKASLHDVILEPSTNSRGPWKGC